MSEVVVRFAVQVEHAGMILVSGSGTRFRLGSARS